VEDRSNFLSLPKLAMQAPAEKLAYVAALNANGGTEPDPLVVMSENGMCTVAAGNHQSEWHQSWNLL